MVQFFLPPFLNRQYERLEEEEDREVAGRQMTKGGKGGVFVSTQGGREKGKKKFTTMCAQVGI